MCDEKCDKQFDFMFEVCGTCAYFYTVQNHVSWDTCRFWVPTPTAINQYPYPVHVPQNYPACGQYKRNPFKLGMDPYSKENQAKYKEMIKERDKNGQTK
jgi:hypothetical protein